MVYKFSLIATTACMILWVPSAADAGMQPRPAPGQTPHALTSPVLQNTGWGATSGKWTGLQNAYPGTFPDLPLLLTDGTVAVHEGCTPNWYKLTPDKKGSYRNGKWSTLASMPSGYAPLYFASQVLSDGRVIVNGGLYNDCSYTETNKGALYDPASDSWTAVSPPPDWPTIGEAPSVVRTDKTYQVADCCSTDLALASSTVPALPGRL